ncbi:flagellar biosynthesis anti-sigma factor FlgM [Nitrosomonas halophila]|uniref:Negative regulator of flagellin synthesis n=1 Tax=Nitrosomonas halophila TaxID=44576 RepID=A0A1H3C0V3_9PROT|nr:flagellar biosynthesis anti-sigma factor FlgM [Nitrosomonas halophila]SDX47700.1 negative regulator of flagellin synthesis FlgM [Nitrosomonas halophila]HRQ04751.1 flagellar biosynthesis anti-sigma factor FlgM [Nitrosomonas halophila]
MKIDQTIRGRSGVAADGDQGKVDKAGVTKPDAVQDKDHVHISPLATQIQAAGPNDQVVDAAKVAEIKQAISEGRFKVNPEVVADRLLESVKELIQTKRPPTGK